MTDKLLVVDGHNLLVRAIKAMEYRSDRDVLMTTAGVVTGPVVSFINMLTQHCRLLEPTHLVVCWDGGKSPYRVNLDPKYKGNRTAGSYGDEAGPDSPFTLCKEFLSLSGVPWILRRSVEADDLVAAFVANFTEVGGQDRHVYILSNDKDFFQLVSNNVTQVRIGTDVTHVTPKQVEEKLGVAPEHVADLMALMGDTGDNVRGVPGIGPKTAAKILKKWEYSLYKAMIEEPRLQDYFHVIKTNHQLVDLRLPIQVMLGTDALPEIPLFTPTNMGSVLYQDLLDWLSRYELLVIRKRLELGTLWRLPNLDQETLT